MDTLRKSRLTLSSSCESSVDRSSRRHVQGKLEDVGVPIREVGEVCWFASRGYKALGRLASDQFCYRTTDSR